MKQITITIDGANFSNLLEFYDEIERTMTKDLNWRIGRNLDAFNDVLRGGFGVFEDESINLIWKNAEKSKIDLGYDETTKYYKRMLIKCHPQNRMLVDDKLSQTSMGVGETLFDMILGIIRDDEHDNIALILE